jgi:polyhydroxybutyrate depolymerase
MQCAAFVVVLLFGVWNSIFAAEALTRSEWKVEGIDREALVYVPAAAKTAPSPVIFAFHGHGGTMRNAARNFAYHTHWPEAIAVYMQGLNSPGVLTDPEGKKPGWQRTVGDQNDRDLKFFDAVLATLKKDYQVDEKRIYATGHSNGGAFVYVLWSARGEVFAAVAPCAAPLRPTLKNLKPKPVLLATGEKDQLVRFAWQERSIEALKKLNKVGEGTPWGKFCTLYPSSTGTPLVTYIHPGGHELPPEVPPTIVKFFKERAEK